MPEEPTKKDAENKTYAVDTDGEGTPIESDVIGNDIDDDVNDIDDKIQHLIRQFDDGEPFGEKQPAPVQSSTEIRDVNGTNEAVSAGSDIDLVEEKRVDDGEWTSDIQEGAEEMDVVNGKRVSSRIIFIVGGAFIFLLVVAAVCSIRPTNNIDKVNYSKKIIAHKIPPPAVKHPKKKIVPPENDVDDKVAEPVDFKENDRLFFVSDAEENTAVIPSTASNTYPYTIHIGSYQDKENVGSLISQLKEEGIVAFTSVYHVSGEKDLYRVFANYYPTLEDAQNEALKLKKEKSFYVKIVNKPYAIQVGLFDSNDELKQVKTHLWSKGYTPYSISDPHDATKTRLLMGAYDSITDAADQIEKLKKEGFDAIAVSR